MLQYVIKRMLLVWQTRKALENTNARISENSQLHQRQLRPVKRTTASIVALIRRRVVNMLLEWNRRKNVCLIARQFDTEKLCTRFELSDTNRSCHASDGKHENAQPRSTGGESSINSEQQGSNSQTQFDGQNICIARVC